MKRAVVFVANGTEEVEAVTPIDYLRRAGVEVVVAGIGERDLMGAHDIRLTADLAADDTEGTFDLVVVPGGRGCEAIGEDESARNLITKHFRDGRLTASICAAPVWVLGKHCGILSGRRFTCYPGLEKDTYGGTFTAGRVVEDGNLITSRAAGCAGEFSVALVRALLGKAAAEELASKVLL